MLHLATDDLNNLLGRLEVEIGLLGLGVGALVPLQDGVELRFGKFNGAWGLLLVTGEQVTPLRSTSREHRLQAVAALPTLLTAMVEAVDSEVAKVEGANRTVERLLGEIASLPKPEGP